MKAINYVRLNDDEVMIVIDDGFTVIETYQDTFDSERVKNLGVEINKALEEKRGFFFSKAPDEIRFEIFED